MELFTILLVVQTLAYFVVAARVGSRLGDSSKTPINTLAATVAKVVNRHWTALRPRLSELAVNPVHLRALQVAQEYLNQRAAAIYRLECARAASRAEAWRKAQPTKERPPPSPALDAVLFLVGSLLAGALVAGLLFATAFLIASAPGLSIALVAAIVLLMWLATRPSGLVLDYVPVIGPSAEWAHYQPRSSAECSLERQHVFMAIVSAGGGIGGTGEERDADIQASAETAVPAPPGITELVLAAAGESMDEIRSELEALRRWHKRVFALVFLLFVLVVVGSTVAGLVWFKSAWGGTVGGVGFAVVLGGMLWGFLPAIRTSYIALALYRSYQVELVNRLAAARAEGSPEKRLRLEAQAWDRFRSGLNQLWLQENRSRSTPKLTASGRAATRAADSDAS